MGGRHLPAASLRVPTWRALCTSIPNNPHNASGGYTGEDSRSADPCGCLGANVANNLRKLYSMPLKFYGKFTCADRRDRVWCPRDASKQERGGEDTMRVSARKSDGRWFFGPCDELASALPCVREDVSTGSSAICVVRAVRAYAEGRVAAHDVNSAWWHYIGYGASADVEHATVRAARGDDGDEEE